MKHTLTVARTVAVGDSTSGPHAPYMLVVYVLAEKIKSGELKPGDRVRASPSWPGPTTSATARPGGPWPS